MTYTRMVHPVVFIDWGTGTDADTSDYNYVSERWLRQNKITISFGRDQARSTAPPKTETADLTLDNTDGRFNQIAGPLAGFVTRGPVFHISISWEGDVDVEAIDVDAEDPTIPAEGYLSELVFNGNIESAVQGIGTLKTVAIRGLGQYKVFNNSGLIIPLMENVTVDEILHEICDIIGYDPERRVIDAGDTQILYFWMGDERPATLLPRLQAAEGASAAIYTDQAGNIHFEGGQYRSNNDRSTNIQYYLYDKLQTSDPPLGKPIYYHVPSALNQDQEFVYNKIHTPINYRIPATLGQVWSYGASISLAANETRVIYAAIDQPVSGAVTPALTTDYQLSTGGIAAISLSATSGTRILLTITATAAGALIIGPSGQESDGIYIRAVKEQLAYTQDITSSEDGSASIARYGLRELSVNMWPEINPNNAQDIVNGIFNRYKEPRDQMEIRVWNQDHAHTMMIALSKISDRIHIVSTHQGIDHDFFIENKTFIMHGNGNIECVFGIERAFDLSAFRFGISVFGSTTDLFGE